MPLLWALYVTCSVCTHSSSEAFAPLYSRLVFAAAVSFSAAGWYSASKPPVTASKPPKISMIHSKPRQVPHTG